jgi:spermidine/putrescine-binding protein
VIRTSRTYVISRLIVAAVILWGIAGCNAKPAEEKQHVTSSGFTCPEPNPRVDFESKEINIFTWTEYIPADILECFGLVYDVKVNTDYFSSNEELNAKMTFGKDTTQYDVIHPSDYMIDVLAREDVLQTLDQSKLPNLKNLDPELLKAYGDTVKYVVPYQMGTQAIVYNSSTVSNPPASWADLWNPEFKNRIVAVDDSRVLIGAALLTLGYDINTTDPEQLNQAKEKLIELMPNIKVFDSDSPKTPLIAGDVDLGIVWNGEAFLAQRENPDFQYAFPQEGSIIFYDGMGIPRNAPHADASYAWLNYLLQGDVNWLTLVDYPYTNPNRAALDFAKQNHQDVYDAYSSSPITNTPAQYFLQGHNVEDVGDALPLYDEIWTEVKQ